MIAIHALRRIFSIMLWLFFDREDNSHVSTRSGGFEFYGLSQPNHDITRHLWFRSALMLGQAIVAVSVVISSALNQLGSLFSINIDPIRHRVA